MDEEILIICCLIIIGFFIIIFLLMSINDESEFKTNECNVLIFNKDKWEDGHLYLTYNDKEKLYLLAVQSKEKEYSIVIPENHINYILEEIKSKEVYLRYDTMELIMNLVKQDNIELVGLLFKYFEGLQTDELKCLVRSDLLFEMFKLNNQI